MEIDTYVRDDVFSTTLLMFSVPKHPTRARVTNCRRRGKSFQKVCHSPFARFIVEELNSLRERFQNESAKTGDRTVTNFQIASFCFRRARVESCSSRLVKGGKTRLLSLDDDGHNHSPLWSGMFFAPKKGGEYG